MVNNRIVQIVVLVFIALGAWWMYKNGVPGNDTTPSGVAAIVPVSVSDSFEKTNPFGSAEVDPLAGYTNPFSK